MINCYYLKGNQDWSPLPVTAAFVVTFGIPKPTNVMSSRWSLASSKGQGWIHPSDSCKNDPHNTPNSDRENDLNCYSDPENDLNCSNDLKIAITIPRYKKTEWYDHLPRPGGLAPLAPAPCPAVWSSVGRVHDVGWTLQISLGDSGVSKTPGDSRKVCWLSTHFLKPVLFLRWYRKQWRVGCLTCIAVSITTRLAYLEGVAQLYSWELTP